MVSVLATLSGILAVCCMALNVRISLLQERVEKLEAGHRVQTEGSK